MACQCLSLVNEKLSPEHMLNATMAFRKNEIERPIISLIRKDTWKLETRRGKRSSFICTFCPFCGVRYKEGDDL